MLKFIPYLSESKFYQDRLIVQADTLYEEIIEWKNRHRGRGWSLVRCVYGEGEGEDLGGLGKFYYSVKEVKQIVISEVASSMK